MWEFIKNHYGKILTGTTGTIIFTVGGIWFSDIRYAHTKDVEKNIAKMQQQIDDLKSQIKTLQH